MPSEVRTTRRRERRGGGLDSIRARILACIAARNYDQAREYLKLAANMTDDEQARFEQMIALIQTTVTQVNFVGVSVDGNRVYARLLETGSQIWVFVRDGTIRDGGCNDVAWSVEALLK